jgi:ATP/maltotriose-dependent transcriptional regulator MalT
VVTVQVILLEVDVDMTAVTQTLCTQVGLTLTVVRTIGEAIRLLERHRSCTLLIIDGTGGRTQDLEHWIRLVKQVSIPIHLIHTRQEMARSLATQARGPINWIDANGMLTLRDSLRFHSLTLPLKVADHACVPLSEREQQVLDALGKGHIYSDIATMLGVSLSTVKTHARHLKTKLRVTKRADLVRASQKFSQRSAGSVSFTSEEFVCQARPKGVN